MVNCVLLTGANGFVGKQLMTGLVKNNNYSLRAAVRNSKRESGTINFVSIEDINAHTDWSAALKGCDVVIHTAARVHIMKEFEKKPLEAFRQVNVLGTLNLARQAAAAGVRRFIFISSIKVNGETTANRPFHASDTPKPEDPYAISKYEAEQGLLKLSIGTGMEIVIIRPPLIYGPGVKGNFRLLMNCIKKRLPLPLGAIDNKRSFVSVFNLVDLVITCIDHPEAANQVFLVSDGEDISITTLLTRLGASLGLSPLLIPLPVWFLTGIGTLVGKRAALQRVCECLQVDIQKTCELLGWKPVIDMKESLFKTVHEDVA